MINKIRKEKITKIITMTNIFQLLKVHMISMDKRKKRKQDSLGLEDKCLLKCLEMSKKKKKKKGDMTRNLRKV